MTAIYTPSAPGDFDRALDTAFGKPTPAEMDAELKLLAAMDEHRQRVAEACAGRDWKRKALDIGSANCGQVTW